VRQVVFNPRRGIPALNMKFRIEPTLGQEIAVYTSIGITRHFSIKVGPTAAAFGSRCRLQSKSAGLAPRYGNCRRRVKGNTMGSAVNGLAVIAMTHILRQWLAGQTHLDGTATTLNIGNGHRDSATHILKKYGTAASTTPKATSRNVLDTKYGKIINTRPQTSGIAVFCLLP
jgi:hypothetical protein